MKRKQVFFRAAGPYTPAIRYDLDPYADPNTVQGEPPPVPPLKPLPGPVRENHPVKMEGSD